MGDEGIKANCDTRRQKLPENYTGNMRPEGAGVARSAILERPKLPVAIEIEKFRREGLPALVKSPSSYGSARWPPLRRAQPPIS
jgi:hypothetical protein